ncbi:MAG TPA: HAD family hydrolase [Dehalococcoidia bacterium]|jgi:FMN phosphatase YigB (HAD superfamily)
MAPRSRSADLPSLRPSAVLLDVGGTLWPDRWPARPSDRDTRAVALQRAVPGLTPSTALRLHDALTAGAGRLGAATAPALAAVIEQALSEVAAFDGRMATPLQADDWTQARIRAAMCLPAPGRVRLFRGARSLLACIRALGLRCIVVSNSTWRDAAAYRRDFAAFGAGELVDEVIASVDLPACKPDPLFFDAALAAAGCAAERCVLIGNSEANDIAPALARGMRGIRAAIEEPLPVATAAEALVTSLAAARRVLTAWCTAN